MARKFRDQGQYDWFRGQLEDWPLKSSFARLSTAQKDDAMAQVERFISWAKATPGLGTLGQDVDVDATCGVAQHYGIPTNYIDFTTSPEVAGFFAADNPSGRRVDRESCIICLNTADAKTFWKGLPSDWPSPEFIEIQVPNLWRLEAQEGRFLFCPAENFEDVYNLDRIVFPYTGASNIVPREKIYPLQKSALEILLDQFFMNERRLAGTQIVRKMPFMRLRFEDTGGWNPELVATEVHRHPSWSAVDPLWTRSVGEAFAQIASGPVTRLEISAGERPQDAGARVAKLLAMTLAREPRLRSTSLSWQVDGGGGAQERSKRLVAALRWLWDGMRSLPYSADQLASAAGQCVALWQAGAEGSAWDAMTAAARQCLGDAIEVEFGVEDSAYAKAFASERSILRAVRPDVVGHLRSEFRNALLESASGLLMAVTEPSRLFDFPLLVDVFARELIPCQVHYRHGAHMAIFSPARLRRFGLP